MHDEDKETRGKGDKARGWVEEKVRSRVGQERYMETRQVTRGRAKKGRRGEFELKKKTKSRKRREGE